MDPTSPHRSSMLEKFHLFTVHVTSPNWVKPATTHDSCCFLPFLLLHCTTRIHTPQPTLSKIHNPSLFFPTNKHFSLLSLCSLPLFIYWETVVGRISYFLFAFPTPSQKSTLHASLGFHVHCCFLSLVSIHYFSCFLLSSLFFITKIKFNSAFLFFFFLFLLVFLSSFISVIVFATLFWEDRVVGYDYLVPSDLGVFMMGDFTIIPLQVLELLLVVWVNCGFLK